MMSVTQTLRSSAALRGASAAVCFGGRERSWREWLDDVARLAAGLLASGLQAGDRVAIAGLNSDRYLDALYAIAWAGGVAVPINTRLSVPELAYILAHAEASCIFVDASLKIHAAEACEATGMTLRMIGFEPGDADDDIAALIAAHDPVPDAGRAGDDVSGIFYTGGTTGRSKGVMLSHANHVIHSLAMWCGQGVDPDNLRYLHAAPMFHAADAEFIYAVTLTGGAHYAIPRFDAAQFLAAVAGWRITDCVLVPTMIQMLLDHPDLPKTDTSSLVRLWYGGSPMAEAVIRRVRQALPGCALVQLYGQTEAGPMITMLPPGDHDPQGPHPERLRAAGRPVPGCEVRVVDPEGRDVPAGNVGEVICRSGSVMLGYWKDAEQTAEALKHGWLHTGDAGYLDEFGYLFVTDRFKDMIITGGENVFSTEVEQAIYGCSEIAQCAVIGVPDPRWGERVHAILVAQPNRIIDLESVTSKLRRQLAGYKIPRSFEIRETLLPVSGAGKILKRALRDEMAQANAVNPSAAQAGALP